MELALEAPDSALGFGHSGGGPAQAHVARPGDQDLLARLRPLHQLRELRLRRVDVDRLSHRPAA